MTLAVAEREGLELRQDSFRIWYWISAVRQIGKFFSRFCVNKINLTQLKGTEAKLKDKFGSISIIDTSRPGCWDTSVHDYTKTFCWMILVASSRPNVTVANLFKEQYHFQTWTWDRDDGSAAWAWVCTFKTITLKCWVQLEFHVPLFESQGSHEDFCAPCCGEKWEEYLLYWYLIQCVLFETTTFWGNLHFNR